MTLILSLDSPQVGGADMSLDPQGGAEDQLTVLPQALEHHLHGVLQEAHDVWQPVRKHSSSQLVSGRIEEKEDNIIYICFSANNEQHLLSRHDSFPSITFMFGSNTDYKTTFLYHPRVNDKLSHVCSCEIKSSTHWLV